MAARPFELVRLDLSRPGSEHDAIHGNTKLAELHAEGWDLRYCWITIVDDGRDRTQAQYLNVIMVPPRVLDDAERGALTAMIEATKTEGPAVRGELAAFRADLLAVHRTQLRYVTVIGVLVVLVLVASVALAFLR